MSATTGYQAKTGNAVNSVLAKTTKASCFLRKRRGSIRTRLAVDGAVKYWSQQMLTA